MYGLQLCTIGGEIHTTTLLSVLASWFLPASWRAPLDKACWQVPIHPVFTAIWH